MFDQLGVGDLVTMASEQPRLAHEEETRLVARIREGDAAAVESLVLGNLRIAVDEAIRTRGLGLPQRALVRTGVRTLVEAARTYEPAEHGAFSAYARTSVREALFKSISVS